MNKIELLKRLEKYVVFNSTVFKNLVGKDKGYSKLLLHRLKKSNYIFEIERNRYTMHKDAFLITSHIVWPSYISLWSAIRYYNLTEQIPHAIWVITTRKRKKKTIRYLDTEIIFVLTKPKYFFGFKKVDLKGFEIFVAEPEKAIIDSLLFRKISFSEIHSIIKVNIKNINTKKLIDFTLRTNNKTLIKRVGFLLDKLGFDYYKKLKNYIYAVYTPLEYNLPSRGEKNKKWRIIENVTV